MKACRYLLPAIFLTSAILIPVTSLIAIGQETPDQNADPTSNPFVTPAPDSEAEDASPTPTPSIAPEEAEIVTPEVIAAPVVEEVPIKAVPSAPTPVFFDAPAASYSDREISKQKVAELRQARALYRANQRMARMEYNLWIGHQPLRPRWAPMPMMNSRYSPPTIIVPVFVNPR